jgi:predicted RNase H-like HicB family nuclease
MKDRRLTFTVRVARATDGCYVASVCRGTEVSDATALTWCVGDDLDMALQGAVGEAVDDIIAAVKRQRPKEPRP